ncbi:MAG: hypothetical protein IPI38_18370 [Gemmatimonadetes bacterium]|nr:hypothetical protein [Gemmatimonadota bacterium]
MTTADVVLPMVYPSHYYQAIYGAARPNDEPYRVVKGALADGLRRGRELGGSTAEIRPYLQAFTLGQPRYTPEHARADPRRRRPRHPELGAVEPPVGVRRADLRPRRAAGAGPGGGLGPALTGRPARGAPRAALTGR